MQEILSNNTPEGKLQIKAAFDRVPQHNNLNQYKYIPIHKLPAETVIQMDCGSKNYTLIKHQNHMCTLINHQNATVADIRITTEVLAPTSTLQANVISDDTSKQPDTFESPVITRLCIPTGAGAWGGAILDDSSLPINRPLIARAL